ncbi:MAG: peptidoglycan bridge formation glycyltransferase FemA/FemB family protein [Anaerolineae bacterium]|nr:peptidoglycan bridge formation glycyltransferase FemA/FemB family protein [Anaerolineae bacterium]
MTVEIVHPSLEHWQSFVEAQSGNFLQTAYWAKLKCGSNDWDYELIALEQHGQIIAGALVLYRQLPLGFGTIAYIPRGPVIDWRNEGLTMKLLAEIDAAARRRQAILLKVEPDTEDSSAMREQLSGLGLRASMHTIQPQSTILVDTTGTEEDILARMNQGARRKIRTAEKRDVETRHGNTDDIASFFEIMKITSQRDKIGIRNQEYYHRTLDIFGPNHATLILASHQGHDLGGLIALALGPRAWYLYGASSNDERERMPNYAVQWEALRWARERGCNEYDLWGIPDADEKTLEAQFQHRRDGMWGLYGFKRSFGGRIWRTVGAWDRPYNLLIYAAYQIATKMRYWWQNRRHITTTQ